MKIKLHASCMDKTTPGLKKTTHSVSRVINEGGGTLWVRRRDIPMVSKSSGLSVRSSIRSMSAPPSRMASIETCVQRTTGEVGLLFGQWSRKGKRRILHTFCFPWCFNHKTRGERPAQTTALANTQPYRPFREVRSARHSLAAATTAGTTTVSWLLYFFTCVGVCCQNNLAIDDFFEWRARKRSRK